MQLAYSWLRDEVTRRAMLPRDADGRPIDPVEDLDESLAENHTPVVDLHSPDREAAIAALG